MPETKYQSWNLYENGITQSLLMQFLTCPEKTSLSQIEGLAPARISGALAFGSLVHEALDKLYSEHYSAQQDAEEATYVDLPGASADLVKSVLRTLETRDRAALQTQIADANAEEAFEENYALAEVTLIEYFNYWTQDYANIRWLALEDTFRFLYNVKRELNLDLRKIPINGKFDGVFRHAGTGRLRLFETKTKSRIDDDTLTDTLPYNLQVMLYLKAMERLYRERPDGVLYNIIRKCQLKRGQNQTLQQFISRVQSDIRSRPDFYFLRYDVNIDADEQRRWQQDFKGMLRALIYWYEGIDGGANYRNSASCSGAFGKCEFLPICSRNDDTSFVRKLAVFPELEAGAE